MQIGVPVFDDRKPKQKWYFDDDHLTGIIAHTGSIHAGPYIILPYALPDEQRDLLLWAFEAGLSQGKREGREAFQREVRNLLGVQP